MGRPRPGAGMRVKIVLAGLLVVLAGLVGVPLASAEVPPAPAPATEDIPQLHKQGR